MTRQETLDRGISGSRWERGVPVRLWVRTVQEHRWNIWKRYIIVSNFGSLSFHIALSCWLRWTVCCSAL